MLFGSRCARRLSLVALALLIGSVGCHTSVPTVDRPDRRAPGKTEQRTSAERERYRSFLRFYAPLILKQAHEAGGLAGRDWITQFHFDDRRLSNNRARWVDGLPAFVDGSEALAWAIRPTLYTHAIEFSLHGEKSLVLVYHVYHAMQDSAIHDWERVELRLDGVGAAPGRGEALRFVVITSHRSHLARDAHSVRWYQNPSGKHVLIWQAAWVDSPGGALRGRLPWKALHARPRKAELRFVEEGGERIAARLASTEPARVALGGVEATFPFHYVFVPGANESACAALRAETLSRANAGELAARKALSDASAGVDVKRIRYELQDTADLLVSHWDRREQGVANPDWTLPIEKIWIETAVRDEAGRVLIPVGLRSFLVASMDDAERLGKARRGYPGKHWFWGAYHFGRAGNFFDDAFARGAPGGARARANACGDCLGVYWLQHDYFAHSGARADLNVSGDERGQWLPRGWQRAEAGGFDGRWVQLFDDSGPKREVGSPR